MATENIVVYGPGGHDPALPNSNVIATSQVVVPTIVQNSREVFEKAAAALALNATYLALATPTAAQNTAQIKRLTREVNGLIRFLLGAFEDVSDT